MRRLSAAAVALLLSCGTAAAQAMSATPGAPAMGSASPLHGTGAGSKIRRPLGYAIVGGLILSQLLTLFTTPVVCLDLDRLQGWIREWRKGQGRVEPEALPAA